MTASFRPPVRTLMGPGPSDVHPRVVAAMARPTIGHLDPQFVELMEDIKRLLQMAFRTENALTIPVSAPGTAAMEACFANFVEPGDEVIVCQNGVFGGRMKQMVERMGATPIVVSDEWGRPVDPNKVEDACATHPNARTVAWVQAETSTGAESNTRTLAEIARRHDCLTIVDTVTALAGTPIEVDGWQLDAVYSGSQKCLSCPPGLAPLTVSDRAVARLKARATPVQSWFLDLTLVMGYWGGGGKRAYHHTAPVNALYGLHEALIMLEEEGLEAAWARHRHHHEALRAGLEAMGLNLLVPPPARLPQLNTVTVPEGVDEAEVRARLLNEYGLEIGSGLGELAGRVWRVGLMGHASQPRNVLFCLSALEAVLGSLGASIERGVAIGAAQQRLDQGRPPR